MDPQVRDERHDTRAHEDDGDALRGAGGGRLHGVMLRCAVRAHKRGDRSAGAFSEILQSAHGAPNTMAKFLTRARTSYPGGSFRGGNAK
jgi:hypothetical protein